MKIYIACGLTHVPRSIFLSYTEYLHALAKALCEIDDECTVKYALVHSDPQLALKPVKDRAALCYSWDRGMVEEADLVVADASFPSTGLGIELQIAHDRGTPIIMLIGDYRVNRVKPASYINPDASRHDLQVGAGIVSLMALGLPSIRHFIPYDDVQCAIKSTVDACKLFVY